MSLEHHLNGSRNHFEVSIDCSISIPSIFETNKEGTFIEFLGYSEQTKSFVRADNSLQTALHYVRKMLYRNKQKNSTKQH
jgi:hypothetical protein